jgi:CRP/FNR family transcriptional regulator, cyclic AMP receptor protein
MHAVCSRGVMTAPIPARVILGAAETLQARSQRAGRRPAVERAWMEVLPEVPLFAGLSKRHVKRIAAQGSTARYAAGSMIVWRGARGDAFHVILEGDVDVLRPDGGTVRLGPGDFFGELALIDGKPRSAAVRATSRVTTMRLNRPPFQRVLRAEPTIAVALLEALAERLREAEAQAGSDAAA